ncbi:PREDICTED: carboxypeptidase N subunit 2-like, partial [Polistes canadensis]|uniref:carboxypeptidase N subunit 2-like n=1 Tax=Polistes canadensis TaxID=91411 RepID=UPI000718C969
MFTIILIIFFLFFTTINANTNLCQKNPVCQCRSDELDDINVVYRSNINTTFTIKVKSWSDLKIDCKDMGGWNNFNFTSNQSEKILNSLEFKYCGLPNTTTLKNIVKKLGVEETNTLIFQSFKDLGDTLKREHLQEFSNVTKLVLLRNGLTNIPYDLFSDLFKLEYLDISVNNIILPKDIFVKTTNLKRLELYGNNIKEFVPGLFSDLLYLEYLNLMGNSLVELDAEVFNDLISLKNLNLGVNMLKTLPQSIFRKLK